MTFPGRVMERVASPFFTETRCTETAGAGLGVASVVEGLQPQRAFTAARAKPRSAYRTCRRSADTCSRFIGVLVRSKLRTLEDAGCVRGHLLFRRCCGQECPRAGS